MTESRFGFTGARALAPAKKEGPPAGLWERPRLSGPLMTGPVVPGRSPGPRAAVVFSRDRSYSVPRSVEFRIEIGPCRVAWWSQGRWMEESSLTLATATP